MTFTKACLLAMAKSDAQKCTIHVCALLAFENGEPAITGYTLSDWYDGSVVCSYTNGERHS